MEIAEQLRTGWLVDVAKAGDGARLERDRAAAGRGRARRPSPPAAAGPSSACSSSAWRSIIAGVHEIKDAVDRPRPGDGLVATSGSSFPSAHAAYSTFYVWLAVTIVMRLRPGMARGALVVAAGIALTALIGLSRVYLDVHYMSDVNAGWALGAAAFSLCAAVALVITTMRAMRTPHHSSDGAVRQNGARAAARPAEDRK